MSTSKSIHADLPKWILTLYLKTSYHLKRSTTIGEPLNFGGNIDSIWLATFTHLGGKLSALSEVHKRRRFSAWSRLQCSKFLDLPVMTQQVQQYLGICASSECYMAFIASLSTRLMIKKLWKHNNKFRYYSANIYTPLKKHCVDCDWALLGNKWLKIRQKISTHTYLSTVNSGCYIIHHP